VNRILFVKNLPFNITGDDLYEIFGRYGAIRQVRLGNTATTKGKAFVVFEDIYDAKAAADHLSNFNVGGRYIIVTYHQADKVVKKVNLDEKAARLAALKAKRGWRCQSSVLSFFVVLLSCLFFACLLSAHACSHDFFASNCNTPHCRWCRGRRGDVRSSVRSTSCARAAATLED
jgi:pre-mRNA branch site protein p14